MGIVPEDDDREEATPADSEEEESDVGDVPLIPLLEGVLDDLENVDASEGCIAALVEVVCYYKAEHGECLATLWNRTFRKCEPVQIVPLLRVMEDILLHDVDK